MGDAGITQEMVDAHESTKLAADAKSSLGRLTLVMDQNGNLLLPSEVTAAQGDPSKESVGRH